MQQDTPVSATIPNAKKLAEDLIATEDRIAEIKAELDQLTSKRTFIRSVELPLILSELGLTSIGIGNHTISLQVFIDGSLPKDPSKRKAALDWLHANGHSGVLKHLLVADLPSGDDGAAMIAIDAINALGYNAHVDYNIHPQTYKALAREIVRSGQPAPMEALGIYIQNIAVVET